MIRRYSWAALALAAVACGDSGSSGGGDKPDASTGGTADAGITVVPAKSTDTGKACTATTECGGTGPTDCLTTQQGMLGGGSITFQGGYCTASCTQDSECNPSGGSAAACPAGGLVSAAQSQGGAGLGALVGGFATQLSVCLVKCDASTPCRDGYQCATVTDFIVSAAPALAQAKPLLGALGLSPQTVCLPSPENIQAPDGGLPPAGDAGTDASVPSSDAGSDAGSATDAGTDAGTASDAGDAG
jgi:hypothetical protein